MKLGRVFDERESRREVRAAPKPSAAGTQIAEIQVYGRDVGIEHVRNQRDPASDELPFGFFRARDLGTGFWREHATDVAHVDADFFENVTAHQAGLAAAPQPMALRLAPRARL